MGDCRMSITIQVEEDYIRRAVQQDVGLLEGQADERVLKG